jgi:hypothetical protein
VPRSALREEAYKQESVFGIALYGDTGNLVAYGEFKKAMKVKSIREIWRVCKFRELLVVLHCTPVPGELLIRVRAPAIPGLS